MYEIKIPKRIKNLRKQKYSILQSTAREHWGDRKAKLNMQKPAGCIQIRFNGTAVQISNCFLRMQKIVTFDRLYDKKEKFGLVF